MPPKIKTIRTTQHRPDTKLPFLRKRKQNEKLRQQTLERDNFVCQYCGEPYAENKLECDHIVPLKDGGKDNINNTQTLCIPCHYRKTLSERFDNGTESTVSM